MSERPLTIRCHGCGAEIENSKRGVRKWCSERCRKHTLYSGTCIDCGAPTYNSSIPPPERCRTCAAAASVVWSRELIVARLQEWARLEGHPPSARTWLLGRHPRLDAPFHGYWPTVERAQHYFGSWNAAIAAAGFDPLRVGCYGRDGESLALCEEVRARYEAGESSDMLAAAYGITPPTIRYRIRRAGGAARTQVEAQALRRAREAA